MNWRNYLKKQVSITRYKSIINGFRQFTMAFPKIEGYVVTEKLGSGSYSTVYKAHTKVGARSIVAIKCVDKSRIKNSGSAVDNLITEIRLLKTLTHPHIVHMKHFTWDDRNIYIIMEYCCGGDLSKYIHRYGRVHEKQVLYFLQQLASALKFLREKDVVHMDLKPHNLLLHKGSDGKYVLKVADFGFAQYMCEGGAGVRGSPLYMAPEILRGHYDRRVDLWSVGVIMYECLFGRAPYSSANMKELLDKVAAHAPITIPPNSSISEGCMDLLTRLLKHDPDERISYEEFFNHEYLDLEHMPSKENYEKAVGLIRIAIEAESCGRLAEALAAYRAGLRHLVPAAGAEPDPVRRSALAAKLTRYMERAEEIKESLKQPQPGGGPTAPSLATAAHSPQRKRSDTAAAACCGTAESGNSYDFTHDLVTKPPCVSCGQAADGTPCRCQKNSDTTTDPQRASPLVRAETSPSPVEPGRDGRARFGLKRLFSRRGPVPYLHTDDSSITADKVVANDTNDACRIT